MRRFVGLTIGLLLIAINAGAYPCGTHVVTPYDTLFMLDDPTHAIFTSNPTLTVFGNTPYSNHLNVPFSGSCGITIENISFVGFIARSESIDFSLEVFNCWGNGLQFLLFEYDCATGQYLNMLKCESPGVEADITGQVTGLCIGQSYLIAIDGFSGARCDFELNVSATSMVVPLPSATIDTLVGPAIYCEGSAATYSLEINTSTIDCYNGAFNIDWELFGAGTLLGSTNTPDVVVYWDYQSASGSSILMATLNTANGTTDTISKYIYENDPVLLGDSVAFYNYCLGQPIEIFGETIDPVPGMGYTVCVNSDSIYCCDTIFQFIAVPTVGASLDTILIACAPATADFGDTTYAVGDYVLVLEGSVSSGCDSTIYLSVQPPDLFSAHLLPEYEIPCALTQVTLSPAIGGNNDEYDFAWYVQSTAGWQPFGTNTPDQTVNTANAYRVDVTDVTTGCILTDSTLVTAWYEGPPPFIDGLAAACPGDTLTYELVGDFVDSLQAIAWTLAGATNAELLLDSADLHTVRVVTAADEPLVLSVAITLDNCPDPITIVQALDVVDDGLCTAAIVGTVAVDQDDDCLLTTPDVPQPGARVELQPTGKVAYTDAAGQYRFDVLPGIYEVRFLPNYTLQTACAADTFRTVTVLTDQAVTEDFLIELDTALDLRVTGTIGLTRPGQSTLITLQYENRSNRFVDAELTYTHDPGQTNLTVDDAFDTYNASTQTATLALPQLAPGTVQTLQVQVRTPDTTSVGTVVTHLARIVPIDDDIFPADNEWIGQRTVTASYDPNLKTNMAGVHPLGGDVYPSDSLFDYRIDFQNTGTDTARRVVIRDTLDENFDATTVVPGLGSHPFRLYLEEAHILVFNFPDIILPDSSVNQPASRGFVTYRLRVGAGADVGTQFENSASIYFDANPPVRTNTVINRINKEPEPTATGEEPDVSGPGVFPNPTDGTTTVRWSEIPGPVVYTLYDVTGRQLQRTTASGIRYAVELDSLPAGIYWLVMQRNAQRYVKRVVRQ